MTKLKEKHYVLNRPITRLGLLVGVAALATGCAAHLQTRTVQPSDTYDAWATRMETMPFVFHRAGGPTEVYDVHGHAWSGAQGSADAADGQRVDIYVGGLSTPATSLCSATGSAAASGTGVDDTRVTAAICDHQRTVVSFDEHVRARVLATKPAYVPRVRHLLLEGIWESVAQEPEPLHT
ncbi:hypothetical protein [Luteibacter aegosomatissinici]|uniref:hypothetical protein n=1 Tax=Luteibacter aegosomatissinici TaxID=2911539 RepID=UPI001FF820C1|nr:hypothetical protein [Luteibacter aegosomatissinici]UPG96088.1 hypothetical protein L2Y97_08270 [Luteibacter aegosomatissinici]